MLVNSAFSACRNGWFPMRISFQMLVIAMFLTASSFTDETDRDLKSKQLNVGIREIGHRLLMQAGDLTSRVMPVTEIKPGTFQLKFENKFVFNHDSLMALSKSLLPKTLFPSGYTVTVHDCATGGIVYGFQLNSNSPDILACSGRSEPAGCYTIEFAFPGLYENPKGQSAGAVQPNNKLQADRRKITSNLDGSTKPGIGINSNLSVEEIKPAQIDSAIANSTKKESEAAAAGYSFTTITAVGLLLILGVTLLISRFRKTYQAVNPYATGQDRLPFNTKVEDKAPYAASTNGDISPGNALEGHTHDGVVLNSNEVIDYGNILQDPARLNESLTQLPALGQFLFNVKGQRLHLGPEVITLTDKESKVLQLLYKHFGELIPRETLLQEIWINEGVITGRSLDMFVSKLRKKLSGDPQLRITNVHGKGYKLEMSEAELV